LVLGQPSFCDQ